MKKEKKKNFDKEEKKALKKELTTQIKAALSSVIVNFAEASKGTDKVIAKSTKQLVKKFSKIKLITPVVAENTEVVVEKSNDKKVKI